MINLRLFVIKSKYLFFFILAMIILTVFIGTAGINPVFKVGNREIPIYSVMRNDDKLSLTFNCAWDNSDIESILNTLDKYSVKCTFFIVGEWAEKFPESVKLIAEHGHEVANHSYAHDHYSSWSKEQILADIVKCDNLLESLTGVRPKLFRAAYGEYNDNVVLACEENERFYIQWSVDSIDYGDASANDIYNRVVTNAKAGDIILMHTGTKNTAKILPEILSALTSKYTLCPVSELIYTEDYIIDATGRQIRTD